MTMETAVLSELQSRFYSKDTIQDYKIFLMLSITQTSQRTLLLATFQVPSSAFYCFGSCLNSRDGAAVS